MADEEMEIYPIEHPATAGSTVSPSSRSSSSDNGLRLLRWEGHRVPDPDRVRTMDRQWRCSVESRV